MIRAIFVGRSQEQAQFKLQVAGMEGGVVLVEGGWPSVDSAEWKDAAVDVPEFAGYSRDAPVSVCIHQHAQKLGLLACVHVCGG